MTTKAIDVASASKPSRVRSAPKHLVDGSNSEAPSAAHQAIMAQTQARLGTIAAITGLIKNIENLDAVLPSSVAEGTDNDEIYRVLTTVHGMDEGSADSTFNRRFDILFREDTQCRDANGRLHLIRRGEFGMSMVVQYLRDIKWNAPDMNLEGAMNKLERVVKEMEILWCVLHSRFIDIQFVPANSRIRCLAHVVNLVVQKILAALGDTVDPDTTDDYLPNKDVPFHYDPDNDPVLQELEQEVFTNDDDSSADEYDEAILLAGLASEFKKMTPLQKLRTIATKICSSPQRRKRFRTTAERVFINKLAPSGRKLASLMVIRDVRHRWNYTHAMIERGLMLREAIDTWVIEKPEMRPLSINDDHWELFEALGGLFKMFTQVTEQMSRSGTPTLPWVLPMYEGMLKHLRSAQDTLKFPCLRTAAAAGLEKLKNYYSKACNCQLNIIATLLHPSLGIAWFRKIDKERESDLLNATRVEVLFEHVYESYQQIHGNNDESHQPKAAAQLSRPSTFGSFLDDICMANVEDVSVPEIAPERELKRFWDAFKSPKGDRNAPLTWWKEHEHDFPITSKMARDFLAIPGTSVSVERLFSSARHLCHESRVSFKASTISEAMLTKMWIKDGLLKKASLDCGRG
ncbi:hypothetical protein MVEN_00119300 [Mycena venus]|uniref:HAT C-terminal dimerisation domain-containing protein n=1 Tax=Mycena venus TaxID=2733690 RepID=A0A8H7DGS3_9AGAR|nr:hypothetical protein MVEN_00119300 [Mycena venus]